MERNVTHSIIVAYHQMIADAHIGINGSFRFNWSEITNSLRRGIDLPTLALESHDSDIMPNSNKSASFNTRTISFMILDRAKADDYNKQEEIIDRLEQIGLDIGALLNRDRKNIDHWLYGKFEGAITMRKVGPVFDNLFGWNIIYEVRNHEPMCLNPDVWDFEVDSL